MSKSIFNVFYFSASIYVFIRAVVNEIPPQQQLKADTYWDKLIAIGLFPEETTMKLIWIYQEKFLFTTLHVILIY